MPKKLLVEKPEDKTPRLLITDKDFTPTFRSFRISPIFPAFSKASQQYIPGVDEKYSVVFFYCRSSFSTLGLLGQKLGTFTLSNKPDVLMKSCLWISHGLASIILISDDQDVIEKVKNIIQETSDNLVAIEHRIRQNCTLSSR